MNRFARSLAYVVVFCFSATSAALGFTRRFAHLPASSIGVAVGVLVVLFIASVVAALEGALVWHHWLHPRGEKLPRALESRSWATRTQNREKMVAP